MKDVGPAFDEDEDSTLAAASDVVAKIRRQAAELRRGSAAAPTRAAVPTPAAGQGAGAEISEPEVQDQGESVRVWKAGVEGSLINGAAPPPVVRTFWTPDAAFDASVEGERGRAARRLPWWLPLLLLMATIVIVSVLVALWLASGPVTS